MRSYCLCYRHKLQRYQEGFSEADEVQGISRRRLSECLERQANWSPQPAMDGGRSLQAVMNDNCTSLFLCII